MLKRIAIAAVIASLAAGAALRAQEKHSDTLLTTEHYLDWERVSDAQIAPDGSRIVYWSPDGKSIAFSAFVPEAEKWTISMPAEPKGAKWTAAPRIVDTMHYRQDQVGFLEDGYTHLFVVGAEGGTPRQLTHGKWTVGSGELRGGASIDWTPDSKTIVFNGDKSADIDTSYETSQLFAVDVASGAIRDVLTKSGEWTRQIGRAHV